MSAKIDRRKFVKDSLFASATGAWALAAGPDQAHAQKTNNSSVPTKPKGELPMGKIGDIHISRLLLGGNLLTHYTHSRDLKYVYNLAAHYNTEKKIIETLALAESHGINTLSIHTVPWVMQVLRKYRRQHGGKIQWIICPTAPVQDDLKEYTQQVRELLDNGTEMIYLWGVHADQLAANNKIDLIARAVELGLGVDSPHKIKLVTADSHSAAFSEQIQKILIAPA